MIELIEAVLLLIVASSNCWSGRLFEGLLVATISALNFAQSSWVQEVVCLIFSMLACKAL